VPCNFFPFPSFGVALKLKEYFDNPFEIFWGACSQFPIILIIKWWAIPVMFLCGLLWRLGGTAGGSKHARRIGVPLVLCLSVFIHFHRFGIFLAVPLMIWGCPWSYGADSWLFIKMKQLTGNQEMADLYTRFVLLVWYWAIFMAALLIRY
jgi:hypothetical protein